MFKLTYNIILCVVIYMSVNNETTKDENLKDIFNIIEKSLNNIKYGSITLIIQDGKIIQIENNTKIRMPAKH